MWSKKKKNDLLISALYSHLLEIENAIPAVAYKFTPDDEYLKLSNIAEFQLLYWGEIIQRLHICSSTTIFRLRKWYDAMEVAYKATNYYGFCSAVRGLLEACSDSFSTLGTVIFPIAGVYKHVQLALTENADKLLTCGEVEDELIHYTHARKLHATEKGVAPPSHRAKNVTDYLDTFKNPSIKELYGELCQVSHPSAMSLNPFLMSIDNEHIALHKTNIDGELIKDLLDRHKKTIYEASGYAISTALCGLRLINLLDLPYVENLKLKDHIFKSLDGYPLWKQVAEEIEKSLNNPDLYNTVCKV